MPADSAAIASGTPAPKRRNHRRARTRFDGRLAIGRRVKQLVILFRERLNGDAANDPVLAAAVERAAELQALAEHLRGAALRGDPAATPNAVVRITRLADLSVKRLHLDRHKPQQAGPTLGQLLAGRVP
jgi:hypothetical protein